jgi:hypothetical protein
MTETNSSASLDLATVARTALGNGAGKDPADVPDSLVEAVVHARGDRSVVAAAAERLCPGEPPMELVLFDTDRIGDWVFDSRRPPVIQGASSILEDLNRSLAEDHPQATVFSGGGEGLFLVPAGRGEPLAQEIAGRYSRASRGALTVTTTVLAAWPQDFLPTDHAEDRAAGGARLVSGTAAVLARLRDQVREEKETRLPPRRPVPGQRDRCSSCRDRAGAIRNRFRDEPGELCEPCDHRWEVGRKLIAGESFDDLVERFVGHPKVRESSPRSTFLGFLYADGNALGALFGRLASLSELQQASGDVTGAFAGLRERSRAELRTLLNLPSGQHPPLLALLGGGDETILIAPAALAFHLATRLPSWLDAELAAHPRLAVLLDRYRLPRPSLGMGLVAAPLGYPVRYQHDLAKQLQTSAKTLFYAAGGSEPISALDFEVMVDGNPRAEDLATARQATFGTEEPSFLRTCRPYRAEDLEELVTIARSARDGGFADAQLRTLESGAGEGAAVFLNFLLYQLSRRGLGDKYRDWLADSGVALGDRKRVEEHFIRSSHALGPDAEVRGTWITDLLAIEPFLGLIQDLADSRDGRQEASDAAA